MKSRFKLAAALVGASAVLLGPAIALDRSDRTARLSDPATTASPLPQVLRDATPASIAPYTGGYFSALEVDLIRAAVRGHIRALAERDAARAYESLAPATQDFYATPERFIAALSASLPPLVTAERFALAGLVHESTDAVQLVTLTGKRGETWQARFTVERQPDGGWAIRRCLVEAAADEPGA